MEARSGPVAALAGQAWLCTFALAPAAQCAKITQESAVRKNGWRLRSQREQFFDVVESYLSGAAARR
jgi:hypothetical protein